MNTEEMRDEYFQQGEKNGEKKRSKEVALRMLNSGKYAVDEIAEMSGLSLDVVQDLRA